MADVFISYAREDQEYARKLADSLRKCGLEPWMDDRIKSDSSKDGYQCF